MDVKYTTTCLKIKSVIEEWESICAGWDAEDRKNFDGPAFLYLGSIRVQVLSNCVKVLKEVFRDEVKDG